MTPTSLPPRILCCWFPDWSIQRLISQESDLANCLLILTESTKKGDFVYQCNALAKQFGIVPGMPVSEAETFAKSHRRFVSRPLNFLQDSTALADLAVMCEAYSFRIGLDESESPECLLMDVTGIAHFFTDEMTLIKHLQKELSAQRLVSKVAIANTIGMAWAVAHSLDGRCSSRMILTENSNDVWANLSIETLRIPNEIAVKLNRLGIRTVDQLMRLDRTSLWARFGDELLKRLDQLTGNRQEFITPARPLPRFVIKQSLEHGLTHAESIERFWTTALNKLIGLLIPKRLGTQNLCCHFFTEDGKCHEINVRLCTPQANVGSLADLIRLQLENQRWQTPLVGVELEALEVSPILHLQDEIISEVRHEQNRQFLQLLDRLSNRLGKDAVARPVLRSCHIPELAYRLIPVTKEKNISQEPTKLFPLDRPPALFSKPRPVDAIAVIPEGPPKVLFWKSKRLEITRSWGPERIEFGWWLGLAVRRDYYRVTTVDGQKLWVFRRLQDDCWFWHGEWF